MSHLVYCVIVIVIVTRTFLQMCIHSGYLLLLLCYRKLHVVWCIDAKLKLHQRQDDDQWDGNRFEFACGKFTYGVHSTFVLIVVVVLSAPSEEIHTDYMVLTFFWTDLTEFPALTYNSPDNVIFKMRTMCTTCLCHSVCLTTENGGDDKRNGKCFAFNQTVFNNWSVQYIHKRNCTVLFRVFKPLANCKL